MNTKLRFLLAVALLAAIVISGNGTPAWAGKLNVGALAPAAAGPGVVLAVDARPQGTVNTTPPVLPVPVIPVTGGQATTVGSCQAVTVGSCADFVVIAPPANVDYTGSIVPDTGIPKQDPANLVSCAARVDAATSAALGAVPQIPVTGTQLGAVTLVCWAVLPNQAVFGYYWSGTQWVKTSLVAQAQGLKTCVLVPADAPNPSFAALFDK